MSVVEEIVEGSGKKTEKDLLDQARGFLEYARKNGEISEGTKKEISQILGLSENDKMGFLQRLSRKFGKKINISDKSEIEKVFKKKHINFERIWEEYTKYLNLTRKEEHKNEIRKKVETLFESYRTPNDSINEGIINFIIENYSKDVIEKVKTFLSSNIYREAYIEGNVTNESFLTHFIRNVNNDDLKFLLEKFSLNDLVDVWFYRGIYNVDIEKLRNAILALNQNGYNYEKVSLSLNELNNNDIPEYIKMVNSFDFDGFWEKFDVNDECYYGELKDIILKFKDFSREDVLNICINIGLDKIVETINQRPDIHYENNSEYTTKFVRMFDNNDNMRKFITGKGGFWESYKNDTKYEFLYYIWMVYWTNNWKKNIDFAFEKGFLSGKEIIGKEILSESENYSEDFHRNHTIAFLKLIENNTLERLVNRGTDEKQFCEFLTNMYSIHTPNLEIILKQYPDIKINELNSLKGVLSSYHPRSIEIILKQYPDIKIEELKSLTKILSAGNIYPKTIELIFGKYPDIKIEELKGIEDVLEGLMFDNWEIILKQYPDIKIEELKSLKDILSTSTLPNHLLMIFEKYPNITIQELSSLQDIISRNSLIDALKEINNFGDTVPPYTSLHILDLVNDNTRNHDEIFKYIKNKGEINNDNWIYVAGLYSAIEYFEDDTRISDEIKSTIRSLLQENNQENKNFLYKKFRELLDRILVENGNLSNEEIALLAVINKKGLFNMGQSENLAKFIYQLNKLDKNYGFRGTFIDIKGEISKFVNSHKNNSNELMNSFFQISVSLLEKSPSIYRNLLKLLNRIELKEQEMFLKNMFPLYNVELFLGEKQGKYKLHGRSIGNDVEGQLIPMHKEIKDLLDNINEESHDINSLLNEEKARLEANVKQLFKEKFGIKKIPEVFTNSHIESIRRHSIYLSNMKGCDEEKTAVLGYFLALKLDGKRSEFRAGEYFDPYEYMDDSKVSILTEYLRKRSERNSIYKLECINDTDKRVLQENESNTIIGNTNGIVERLKTIESNIRTLLDDDIYSERQRVIMKYLDRNLGTVLSKQFQKLSSKSVSLTDEENDILQELGKELGEDLTNLTSVQKLQVECKPISSISNFVNKIISENLSKKIEDFEIKSNPSKEILELLNKIGINLNESGVISTNSFLTFVESGIIKGKNILTSEEYELLNGYIKGVRKELNDLYGMKDRLTTAYENCKNKIIDKYFKGTDVGTRFESMSPYFFTRAEIEKENIVSFMTNDLDIVIKNIRQCLGCKHNGCNNDTDLSFGCDDRFFITTSHREGDSSFADELVTLLPSSEGFTFVMDRIYGNNGSTDILLNNIYVLLKKINKLSSELKKQLSIFVPGGIGLTLNEEGINKLKQQYDNIDINQQSITVTVESQPITDSYHEFGGISARSTGNANILGYLIKFK